MILLVLYIVANPRLCLDDDVNRMSGAFELDNMDKAPQTTKNKHTGSLFSAKVIETPRRRSAVGTSDSMDFICVVQCDIFRAASHEEEQGSSCKDFEKEDRSTTTSGI